MNAGNMRRELLEATRTFVLKDPDHFSIAALCRETGIRKSQLRTHFPTKHALMSALVEERAFEPGNDPPADPFPADEPWVKNRFNILERALTLLEARTEEIARKQNPAEPGAEPAAVPEQCATEPPPVVIAPDIPMAHLEMPPLPIERPTPAFDARKLLHARARQQTSDKPSAVQPPAPKKSRGWVWGVVAIWAGCIGLVALLLLISRSATLPEQGPPRLAAKLAAPLKATAEAIATKQGDVLVIDATGSASAPNVAAVGNSDAGAETKTAIQYLKGDGVEADLGMAMRYGQNAAAKGDADAAFLVGALYAKGMAPDAARAAGWYRRAADQGHPKAMYNLAMAHLSGHGVVKNAEEAVFWFTKAAEAGYRDAAVNLGVLYDRGNGVARDSGEALKWYRRAAELGDAEAAERVNSLQRKLINRYARSSNPSIGSKD